MYWYYIEYLNFKLLKCVSVFKRFCALNVAASLTTSANPDWRVCERLSCSLIDSDFELSNVAGALFSRQSHCGFCKRVVRVERPTATYFLIFPWRNLWTIVIVHFILIHRTPCFSLTEFPHFLVWVKYRFGSWPSLWFREPEFWTSSPVFRSGLAGGQGRVVWFLGVPWRHGVGQCNASALQTVLISGNWSYICRCLCVCVCESSFSCLKRLKSYTRNTVGHGRLSSLALLAVDRAKVKSLD